MTKFKRSSDGWLVEKEGVAIAHIRHAKPSEVSDWGNVLMIQKNGRIDRHHSISEAKSDAMKI